MLKDRNIMTQTASLATQLNISLAICGKESRNVLQWALLQEWLSRTVPLFKKAFLGNKWRNKRGQLIQPQLHTTSIAWADCGASIGNSSLWIHVKCRLAHYGQCELWQSKGKGTKDPRKVVGQVVVIKPKTIVIGAIVCNCWVLTRTINGTREHRRTH